MGIIVQFLGVLVFVVFFGTVPLGTVSKLLAADSQYISNEVTRVSDTGGQSSSGSPGRPGQAGTDGSDGASGQDGKPGQRGQDGTVVVSDAQASAQTVTVQDGVLSEQYQSTTTARGATARASITTQTMAATEETHISLLEALRELLSYYVAILF